MPVKNYTVGKVSAKYVGWVGVGFASRARLQTCLVKSGLIRLLVLLSPCY